MVDAGHVEAGLDVQKEHFSVLVFRVGADDRIAEALGKPVLFLIIYAKGELRWVRADLSLRD